MKLITNGEEYAVKAPRGKFGEWFSVKFRAGNRPELPLEGEVRIESDSGELLSLIDTADFTRQFIRGDELTFTNEPEPEPVPEPEPIEPEPGAEEIINILLGVSE